VIAIESCARAHPDGAPAADPFGILVVEDEPSARCGLARAVTELGYRVRAAADGEEAWQLQRRAPADIILSDWRMPRLDGYDLCKRTRAAVGGRYTYFIFMTAMAEREDFLRAMEAGADDYLIKPIDLGELEGSLLAASRGMKLHRDAERARALRSCGGP
jgi:DNA-binding response OmpR family regulator